MPLVYHLSSHLHACFPSVFVYTFPATHVKMPVLGKDPSQLVWFFLNLLLSVRFNRDIHCTTQRLWNWWYWIYNVMQCQYNMFAVYCCWINCHQTSKTSSILGFFWSIFCPGLALHFLHCDIYMVFCKRFCWRVEIAPVPARLDLLIPSRSTWARHLSPWL